MACSDKPGQIFNFLPNISDILEKIDVSKDLVISVDLKNAKLKKLGYKKIEFENRVEILITPETGRFEESDVSAHTKGAKYDLIISLDTPNLERLGELAEPADIFYEVPVINIDHHPANERFGKVNWVELVATSTAEVLVSLIEALQKDKPLLDEKIATALLTGLIYDTSSFQNINTTPKSLTIAAQLVAAGGKQQEIVKNLYKTKTLETLKLWGIILQNVQEDKDGRFIWSSITKEEISQTGSDESGIGGILDELLKSATDVDLALLLSERDGQVHGSLRSIAKGINVSEIADLFGGGGHDVAAAFRVEGNLAEKKELILKKIRAYQKKEPIEQAEVKIEERPALEVKELPKEEIKPTEAPQPIAQAQIVAPMPEKPEEKIEVKPEVMPETKPADQPPKIEPPLPPSESSDPFSFSAPTTPVSEDLKKPEVPIPPKEPIEDLQNGDSLTKW
jgi:phosphoesterase RecJ-like protein